MSFLTTVFFVVGAATVLAIWVAYQRKSNTNAEAKAKAPSATERFRHASHDEDEDEDKDKDKDKCTTSDDDDDDDDESSVSSDSDSDSEAGADSECIGEPTDDTEAECGNSSARRRVVDAFIAVVGRSPTPREICVYVHPDLAAASTADLRRAIKKDYARAPAKKSKKSKPTASSAADPEPYSTTTALAVSSVRQEPDRSGSYKRPKSILVQRADMLKRLDNILSEVEQFRQFIQMM
jgi:hypothetical protein